MVDIKGRDRSSNIEDRRHWSQPGKLDGNDRKLSHFVTKEAVRTAVGEPMRSGVDYPFTVPPPQPTWIPGQNPKANAGAIVDQSIDKHRSMADTVGGPLVPGELAMFASGEQWRPKGVFVSGNGSGTAPGGTDLNSRVIDTIIAEAVGGGEDAMAAVANVIHNRATKQGQTPLQVVKAKNQFEGYSHPGKGVQGAINNPNIRAKVEAIWNGISNGTVPDPTNGGTMFHAKSMTPYWSSAENRHGTVNIGGNVFYLGNQPRPVSPIVPPRRPDTPDANGALTAINTLIGNSNPTASAFAPVSGNLTASPVSRGIPPTAPSTTAFAPQVPTIQPNTLPPSSASPVPPQMALPGTSQAALSPSQQTIVGREPWAPYPIPQQRPAPTLPPQLQQAGQQLAQQSSQAPLQAALEDYIQRQQAQPAAPLSPVPHQVHTLPIDPLTGSVVNPTQAAADTAAARLRMAKVPTIAAAMASSIPGVGRPPSLPTPGSISLGNGSMTVHHPNGQSLASTQRVVGAVPPAVQQALASISASAKTPPRPVTPPYTGPMPDNHYVPPTTVTAAKLPTGYDPSYPFGYVPPAPQGSQIVYDKDGWRSEPAAPEIVYDKSGWHSVPDRLAPGRPGMVAPSTAMAGIPGVPKTASGSLTAPRPQPYTPTQVAPITGLGYADTSLGAVPTNAPKFTGTPVHNLIQAVNGPQSSFLGQMNTGQRPIASFFARLFAGNHAQPTQGQVASALSVVNPSYTNPQTGQPVYYNSTDGPTEIQRMLDRNNGAHI